MKPVRLNRTADSGRGQRLERIVERLVVVEFETDMPVPGLIGPEQRDRMVLVATCEIGFARAGIRGGHKTKDALVIVPHLVVLQYVQPEEAELYHLDRHF